MRGTDGAPAPLVPAMHLHLVAVGRRGGGTEIRYCNRRESSGVIALWRSRGGGDGG